MSERTVIILREKALDSLVSDFGTFVMFVALIGIGWALDSAAMQWVGAICGFITIVAQSANKDKKMTIADARKKLDEIEGKSV